MSRALNDFWRDRARVVFPERIGPEIAMTSLVGGSRGAAELVKRFGNHALTDFRRRETKPSLSGAIRLGGEQVVITSPCLRERVIVALGYVNAIQRSR
jgi:hypothetical protein